MPFKFIITKSWPCNEEQKSRIMKALQYAGDIVQNTYQFEREITVRVKLEDLSKQGGGALTKWNFLFPIKGANYPSALAKQYHSVDDWNRWEQQTTAWKGYDIEIDICNKTNY